MEGYDRGQSTSVAVDRPIFFGIDPNGESVYIYPNVVPVLNALVFGMPGAGRAWVATSLLTRMRQAGYNVRVTIADPRGDFNEKMLEMLGLNRVIVGRTGYIDVFSSEYTEGIDRLIRKTSKGMLCGLEELKQRFAPFFVGHALPIAEAKDLATSFDKNAVKNPLFIRIYITLLAHQLYLHAKTKNEIWIIILNINSAYIDKEILKYLMLAARKLGIAIWILTSDAKILVEKGLLASTMIKILLGGRKTPNVVKALQLRPEEVNWLFYNTGGPYRSVPTVPALLIHGPRDDRYRAFVALEPIKY